MCNYYVRAIVSGDPKTWSKFPVQSSDPGQFIIKNKHSKIIKVQIERVQKKVIDEVEVEKKVAKKSASKRVLTTK